MLLYRFDSVTQTGGVFGNSRVRGESAPHTPNTLAETGILMLTVSEREDHLLAALKAGARGYLLKGTSAHGVAHAVRSTAAGEVYVPPALPSTILYELTRDQAPDPLSDLTERERHVLELVGEGLTNREIGERLYLAEKTVKHHMTGVLQKLHVRSRVEAALLAHQHQSKRD